MGNGASVGLPNLIGSTDDVRPAAAPKKQLPRLGAKSVEPVPVANQLVNATGMSFDGGRGGGGQQLVHGSTVIAELKRQVRQRDAVLERCAAEIDDLRRLVVARDAEVARLKAEINKFKSVLDAKVPAAGSNGGGVGHSAVNGTPGTTVLAPPQGGRVKSDLLATINEEAVMIGQETRSKKQGVSGESAQTGHGVHELRRVDKDFKYVERKNALAFIARCLGSIDNVAV